MRNAAINVLLAALLLAAGAPALAAGKGSVTVNFVDVELSAVAKFVSDVTGRNLIFDDRVKGKVTIIAPTKLRPEDVFTLFVSVLELKGFTTLPSGVDAYKIVPLSEVRRSGIAVGPEHPVLDESFVVRLIPLENIDAEEALAFLKPVISKEGHIASFKPGNMILVVDSGLNMQKVLDILRGIDLPPLYEEPEVVHLDNASAESVAAILNEGVEKRTKKPEDTPARAVADRRLNAVVLFGNRTSKDAMKRLIAVLDIQARETQSAINVIFLENANAEDMAKVLVDLMMAGGREQQQQQSPATAARAQKASTLPFEAASGIGITPDPATNALVIVASPADYQRLAEIVKRLDVRRKQVFVEAMIVEASLEKLKDLGSNWRAAATHDGEPIVIGGVGTIDDSAVDSIITGLSGFTLGGLGNYMTIPLSDGTELTVPGFAALFTASLFDGVVNVLSSPQIMTTDNTEAEILVGENVPFVSKYDVTDSDNVLSSIERKDVGITLRLTPQITKGDYVKLVLYQEISAVKDTSDAIYTSVGPTTTKRSTSTTVIVRDNQTVVIGGLMQEKAENSVTKMPLLGDIPVLGWLFKYKSEKKEKTNLLIFLTPHVIKSGADLTDLTRAKSESFARSEGLTRPGVLLVRFATSVGEGRAIEIISEAGAVFVNRDDDTGLFHLRVPDPKDTVAVAEALAGTRGVLSVEPEYAMPGIPVASAYGIGGGADNPAPREVLVKFRPEVSADDARRLIEAEGGAVLKTYHGLNLYLVRPPAGEPLSRSLERFSPGPLIEYSEPNKLLRK